jgi:hypothetical protein
MLVEDLEFELGLFLILDISTRNFITNFKSNNYEKSIVNNKYFGVIMYCSIF